MLKPSKYTNPDQTIISLSLFLIKYLKEKRVEEYSKLLTLSKKAINSGEVLFLPTMNFLFILGLIEYYPKTDTFEFTGPNETL